MNFRPPLNQHAHFTSPPFASDVESSLGPYPRHEVVQARASLITTVQSESNMVWRKIKAKCGIQADGRRVRQEFHPQMWLPEDIPESWFAPVSLVHVIEDDQEVDVSGRSSRQNSVTSSGDNMHSSTVISLDLMQDGLAIVEPKSPIENPIPVDACNNSSRKADGQSCQNEIWSGSQNSETKESSVKDKVKYDTETQPASHVFNGDVSSEKSKHANYKHDNDFDLWGSATETHVHMYKCDVCSFTSAKCSDTQDHLTNFQHYSASSYLGRKSTKDLDSLIPIYVSALSVLKSKQGLYNKVVPVCPKCHDVFPDIASCCSHTHRVHGMNGAYTMRDVRVKKMLVVTLNPKLCTGCGQVFKNKSLKRHWKMTGHMPVNVPTKCAAEMTFFVCGICSTLFYSFLQCRDHVYKMHTQCESSVVTAYTLEPATPILHLLPFEHDSDTEKAKPYHGATSVGSLSPIAQKHKTKREFSFHVPQQFKKRHIEADQYMY